MPMRVLETTKPMPSVTRMQVRNVPIWWLDTKVRANLKPPLSPNGDAGLIWIGGRILSDQPKRNSDTLSVKNITKHRGDRGTQRLQSPSSRPRRSGPGTITASLARVPLPGQLLQTVLAAAGMLPAWQSKTGSGRIRFRSHPPSLALIHL